jgi:CRISPR-associated protein Csx17
MLKSSAVFPFSVASSSAGHDSASENKTRGEIWLPVWTRAASLVELEYVFREGRSDVARKPARDGVTFARAVASLGVERGIQSFTRFQFQARLGDNYIATALGRFQVRQQEFVDLVREADIWLDRYRARIRELESKRKRGAPPRFPAALCRIERLIFDYCRYGGNRLFQAILIALGEAERELANGESFRFDADQDRVKVPPLTGLSSAWIDATEDHTPEFEIALALASVFDAFNKVGPLRANLEPFDWKNRTWTKGSRSVVWQSAHLSANLAATLERRVLDGTRLQCQRLPFAYRAPASLDAVAQFIAGEVDDRRIDSLLWAFLPVEIPDRAVSRRERVVAPPLPRAYALLKLSFLPYPIEIDAEKHPVSPERAILSLLGSNRLKEACDLALRRLRVTGLRPLGESRVGTARRDTAAAFSEGCTVSGQRLAASLLIPISESAVGALCRAVLRLEPTEEETNTPIPNHDN